MMISDFLQNFKVEVKQNDLVILKGNVCKQSFGSCKSYKQDDINKVKMSRAYPSYCWEKKHDFGLWQETRVPSKTCTFIGRTFKHRKESAWIQTSALSL